MGYTAALSLCIHSKHLHIQSKLYQAPSKELPGQPCSYGYKLPIFSLPANSISATPDYLMLSQAFLLLWIVTLLEKQISSHTCFPELVPCGPAVPESFGVWHKDGKFSSIGSSILRWIAVSVKRQNELCMVPFSPDYNEPCGCRNE